MSYRGYTVDGRKLPSVTTVIDQTLANHGITDWKLRVGRDMAERISREATEWGTGVHTLIERVNRGRHDRLSSDQVDLIQPYIAWHTDNVKSMLGVEQLLVSHLHGYAGTTDAIAILTGDSYPSIIDFKTSKTALAVAEWRLQTAAYAIAADEHLGLVCRRRIILRLSRDEPHMLHVLELPEDRLADDKACFLALLHVWKWQQAAAALHTPASQSIGRIGFNHSRW